MAVGGHVYTYATKDFKCRGACVEQATCEAKHRCAYRLTINGAIEPRDRDEEVGKKRIVPNTPLKGGL